MARQRRKTRLILRRPVPKLGGVGDVVEVAPGHARNYLIPKGLAVAATEANLRAVERRRSRDQARAAHELETAKALAERLAEVSVTIRARVAEEDTLYGSVGAADIAAALQAEGIGVERSQVRLAQPIKHLGIYQVPLALPRGVEATVKVWVVKE